MGRQEKRNAYRHSDPWFICFILGRNQSIPEQDVRHTWIDELNQEIAQGGPFDRFGGIPRETGGCGVPLSFSHYVCRERDHRDMGIAVLALPSANLAAGFISIFLWHLYITLHMKLE